MGEQQQEQTLARMGQEGGRWVNERPSGVEVTNWFAANVNLHEDELDHDHYAPGITLIETKEKTDVVRGARGDGTPLIVEEQNVIYVPYMKVETRVKYFWDYMDLHPEWLGVIEDVPAARLSEPGYFNLHLPPGYFRMPVQVSDNKVASFIGCSKRVRIYDREGLVTRRIFKGGEDVEEVVDGKLIREAPAGTKVVNLLNRYGEDPNALMKAETGAIGRALGMAGYLVLPGSGVATAEDVQEAQEAQGRSSTAPTEVEPEATREMGAQSEEDTLREQVKTLLGELGAEFPNRLAEFQRWARERGFTSINEVNFAGLKGLVRKVERELDQGRQEGDLAAEEEPAEEAKERPDTSDPE